MEAASVWSSANLIRVLRKLSCLCEASSLVPLRLFAFSEDELCCCSLFGRWCVCPGNVDSSQVCHI